MLFIVIAFRSGGNSEYLFNCFAHGNTAPDFIYCVKSLYGNSLRGHGARMQIYATILQGFLTAFIGSHPLTTPRSPHKMPPPMESISNSKQYQCFLSGKQ